LYTVDVGDYMRAPKTIRRQQPLAIYQIGSMTHKVTLNIPDDVDFTNSEHREVFDDQHFSVTSSFDYDRRRISLTNVYKVKQEWVKAVDVADHLQVLKKARKLLSYDGSITHVNNDAGAEPLKTLVQALNLRVKGNQL
jgi:lipopolysaccharide biosynthesis regulator YciM